MIDKSVLNVVTYLGLGHMYPLNRQSTPQQTRRHAMKKFAYAIIFITIFPQIVSSHSGRTDKYGGHNNRKTGTYHFHNAGSVHHAGNPYQNHKTCGVCVPPAGDTHKLKVAVVSETIRITMVQSCLSFLGYKTGEMHGKLSAKTKQAVRSFQARNDLIESGQVTNNTLRKVLMQAAEKISK